MSKQTPVVIVGTDRFARQVAAIFQQQHALIYGFLALSKDEIVADELNDIPVLGAYTDKPYQKMLRNEKLDYFVAVSDFRLRPDVFNELFEAIGRLPLQAIHPTAWVSQYADIAQGVFIGPNCSIEADASIDSLAWLGPNVVVESEAHVGYACNIHAGSVVGRGASLAEGVDVGRGCIIHQGVSVGKGAIFAPGAVVLAQVAEGAKMYGNPAQTA